MVRTKTMALADCVHTTKFLNHNRRKQAIVSQNTKTIPRAIRKKCTKNPKKTEDNILCSIKNTRKVKHKIKIQKNEFIYNFPCKSESLDNNRKFV